MSSKHYKILLIEDDPIYVKALKSILNRAENTQFDISHADNLTDGTRQLAQTDLDVVLLDLSLPDSSGIHTVRTVSEAIGDTPFLVLTSVEDEELAVRAVQAGAQDYLVKTETDSKILLRAIRFAIERHRLMQRETRTEPAPAERDKEPTLEAHADDSPDRLIRVMLVDDSLIALGLLKKLLHSSPNIQVVGTSMNGRDALNQIEKLNPDVVCTDLHMPEMNGIQLVKEIMARFPRPILAISTAVQEEDTDNIFQLLEAGAVDVFPKPRGGFSIGKVYTDTADDLIKKVRMIARVRLDTDSPKSHSRVGEKPAVTLPGTKMGQKPRIVAIGASVGGPQALRAMLPQINRDFPLPIICIQLINSAFLKGLLTWLQTKCALKVKIAEDGETPTAGFIYFPPEDHHLEIDGMGKIRCNQKPAIKGHRPSITHTFETIASHYGQSAIALLLTGSGRDGVEGLQAIYKAGGLTIAQDEESSFAYNLPKQAVVLGVVSHVLPLDQMAPMLEKLVH